MTEGYFHERGLEAGASSEGRRPPKKGGGLVEFAIIVLIAFALVFGLVRPFVVEAFYIPSESMVPTLEVGDRVFVNKFVYRFSQPKRGDVVVFGSTEGEQEDLIKRVVGVPGDEVAVFDGALYVNGERWEEPYLNRDLPDTSYYAPTTVPEGKVFVMGDNRANSRDSRFFGPLPIDNIEGEAFVIFWPPTHIGLL
ncbi:MAG TPA: signal peptidase I [Rubrobacteraceae bacterium]|nr:signal peptidase I [Rubrobacteraceae bacterium]